MPSRPLTVNSILLKYKKFEKPCQEPTKNKQKPCLTFAPKENKFPTEQARQGKFFWQERDKLVFPSTKKVR